MKPRLRRFLATHRRRGVGPGPAGSSETVVYDPTGLPPEAIVFWPTVAIASIISVCVSVTTTVWTLLFVV